MLFSCSTIRPPPFIAFSLFTAIIFSSLFSLHPQKNVSATLLWDYVIWEQNTHKQTDEDMHRQTWTHARAPTHTNGLRSREWTFDSTEMVDLLMAVTVRHHGWFTWTQPHLSLFRLFLPLHHRQMFTGSYQPPKQHSDRVWEKKTDTGRDREKNVRTNNGEKARDNSEIDRLPVGDTVCQ